MASLRLQHTRCKKHPCRSLPSSFSSTSLRLVSTVLVSSASTCWAQEGLANLSGAQLAPPVGSYHTSFFACPGFGLRSYRPKIGYTKKGYGMRIQVVSQPEVRFFASGRSLQRQVLCSHNFALHRPGLYRTSGPELSRIMPLTEDGKKSHCARLTVQQPWRVAEALSGHALYKGRGVRSDHRLRLASKFPERRHQ